MFHPPAIKIRPRRRRLLSCHHSPKSHRMLRKSLEYWVEYTVFASRWIQAPIYLGLILGSVLYCGKFVVELATMYTHMSFTVAAEEQPEANDEHKAGDQAPSAHADTGVRHGSKE